jgi:hypothetical protein
LIVSFHDLFAFFLLLREWAISGRWVSVLLPCLIPRTVFPLTPRCSPRTVLTVYTTTPLSTVSVFNLYLGFNEFYGACLR